MSPPAELQFTTHPTFRNLLFRDLIEMQIWKQSRQAEYSARAEVADRVDWLHYQNICDGKS